MKKTSNRISSTYPNENVNVTIQKQNTYLDVKIKALKEGIFNWPKVSVNSYLLPLGEGKYIPNDDKYWKEFLNEGVDTVNQRFLMKFFALNQQQHSIVYIIENMFNDEISFDTKDKINFTFKHEFPSIDKDKEYGFRIYVTTQDPVAITAIYKDYLHEKKLFTSLEEKAVQNKNIEKLYGAVHLYWRNSHFILDNNIEWNKSLKLPASKELEWLQQEMVVTTNSPDEITNVLGDLQHQDYVDAYQKEFLLSALNTVLKHKGFYNPAVFNSLDKETTTLVDNEMDHLNQLQVYDLNKRLLKSILRDSVDSIPEWANSNTTDLLTGMNPAGIKKAWIGIPDWTNGYLKPDFIEYANRNGYLIGPYASYNTIHKNGPMPDSLLSLLITPYNHLCIISMKLLGKEIKI